MADWQRHLYLNPEWQQCKDDEISVQECAHSIAVKLRALAPFDDEPPGIDDELDGLATEFESIAAEDKASDPTDWFNTVMHNLYDWGDIALDSKFGGKKVCWVDTMSNPSAKEEAA